MSNNECLRDELKKERVQMHEWVSGTLGECSVGDKKLSSIQSGGVGLCSCTEEEVNAPAQYPGALKASLLLKVGAMQSRINT